MVLPGMSVWRKIPAAKIDGNIATDEIIRDYLKHQHYNMIILYHIMYKYDNIYVKLKELNNSNIILRTNYILLFLTVYECLSVIQFQTILYSRISKPDIFTKISYNPMIFGSVLLYCIFTSVVNYLDKLSR